MNNKNKFLLQIFEKIGAPLFTSVNEVATRAVMTGQAQNLLTNMEQAGLVAKLLTNITKASSAISEKLDLETQDPDSDDLQVSLAAILSPVISNTYQLTGQVLKDEDIERITSSFETIRTFSNHFSSMPEGTERLENLPAHKAPHDKTQLTLQNIMGIVPLINAVSAFPFGEDPNKLLKKIITRIQSEVDDIKKELISTESPQDNTSHIQIFNTVIMMYSQCHFSEMARIMAMGDKEREENSLSIDTVWIMFDQRMDMLKTLTHSIVGSSDVVQKTTQTDETFPLHPSEIKAQNTPEADETSAIQNNQSSQESQGPMSFFSKKMKMVRQNDKSNCSMLVTSCANI